jgi:hypothetical protein
MKKILCSVFSFITVPSVLAQPTIVWQTSLLDTLGESFFGIGKSPADGGFFAVGAVEPGLVNECGDILTSGEVWVCKFNASKMLLWSKCYGGSKSDAGFDVVGLPDGGCAVLAQTYSFDGDVTGNHGNSFTPVDYWILRLDADGNLVWQRCFGGSRNDYPFSMISTLDHGLLVIGFTDSNDGDVGDHIGPLLWSDGWVMKLDSDFEIQWSKVYGGSKGDYLQYGLQLVDSSYIVTGQSASSDHDLQNNYGDTDGWIMKLDPQGNVIWSKSYGGIKRDVFNEVHQTADGGFVMCGETASNLIFTPANFQQGNIGFTGYDDAWVFRVDSNGDFKHAAVFGGTWNDEARPCELYPDGTLGVVAFTMSHDSDVVALYPDKNNIFPGQ